MSLAIVNNFSAELLTIIEQVQAEITSTYSARRPALGSGRAAATSLGSWLTAAPEFLGAGAPAQAATAMSTGLRSVSNKLADDVRDPSSLIRSVRTAQVAIRIVKDGP